MEFGSVSGLVGAIISVVLALIVILPVLMGAFRGLKKSAFRLVWVVLFGVLGFAFMSLISNAIMNADLTSLNLQVDGVAVTTVPQYIEVMISSSNPDLAKVIADNPDVLKMIMTVALSIINLIVIVVWYWIIKWVLWPVWALISHFLFKNKKVKTTKVVQEGKVVAEKQQVIKQKKYAWAGALIGLVMGLFSLVFTAIPLAGISDALVKIEQSTLTVQEDGTEKGVLTKNLGENANLIYVYTDSPAGKVLSAVGINQLSSALAKTITTTTTNGVKTSGIDEIVNIAVLTNDIQTLSEIDFANLTKEQWTTTLPKVEKVSNAVFSSGIVKTLYNSLVPYFVDNILNTPDYFIKLPDLGNEVLNDLLTDILKQLKTISVDDIKGDVQVVIKMAGDINDCGILTKLVQSDITLEYLQQKVTTELGSSLNEKLFEMKTINKLLPICLQSAVEYACSQLSVEYVAGEVDLTIEQTKQFFDSFVTDAVAIFKGYDNTQSMPLATSTFENVGDVIDGLKSSEIINTSTFNNLVDYAVDQINTSLQSANLDASVDNLLQKLLGSIKYIPSFKTELKQFGRAYQIVLDDNIDVENIQLNQIAKVLDNALTTFVYQYNKDNIVEFVETYVGDFCTDNGLKLSKNTIDTICGGIKNIVSFENEFSKIESLVDYVQTMFKNGAFESQLKDATTMTALGEKLDQTVANSSVLLSDANCKLLLQDIIKNVELPADLQGTKIDGKDILDVMADNANDITSYKTEFAYISNILSIDSSMTLTEYGKVLDDVKQSVLLNGVIEQVVCDKIVEKADLIDDAEIAQIIKGITSNVNNGIQYQTEFGYLNQLVNFDFNTATLSAIGEKLDGVKDSTLLGGVLNDIITLQIDRQTKDITDTDLVSIIAKVKGNVGNIQSYKTEFEYLQQFVDQDAENSSMTSFGSMLDNFVDSALFGNATNDLLTYALNKGKTQIDSIYEDIYNEVLNNVANISGKVYAQELAYVQSFVDFTNNGEPKTRANIEQYLNDNILDAEGKSKSILIDDELTNQILALAVI